MARTSSLAHCYSEADMFTWLVPPVCGRQQTTQHAVLPTMIMNSPDTILSNIYYISTINTQHMQGPDVYYSWVIAGIWTLHVLCIDGTNIIYVW